MNAGPLPSLAGARCALRPLSETDADDVHLVFGDAEAMRYWDNVPAPTLAETARRLGAFLSLPPLWAGAWHVRDQAGFIGCVFYHHREAWNRRLELGWIALRARWGQGLMVEAVGAVLAHAFAPEAQGGMGANRIELSGFTEAMRERLRAYGLFTEIISWKLRFFVPIGAAGPTVLAKLLDTYPVTRILDREAA